MLVSVERRATYVALLETDCLLPERRRGNPSSGLMSAAIRSCALAAMKEIPRRHKGCSHSLVGAPPPRPERRIFAHLRPGKFKATRAQIRHFGAQAPSRACQGTTTDRKLMTPLVSRSALAQSAHRAVLARLAS
jgi:hypothetical protein